MYRAGYDPQAFITFFEKVQALEKRKPGAGGQGLCRPSADARPHPALAGGDCPHPAGRDEYTVTTSEFDDVKARLARIENKRGLLGTSEGRCA
jgi:beta-barrel assembly-enhancing protease